MTHTDAGPPSRTLARSPALENRPSPDATPIRRHPETGQSLVEFALVLMPLFVIVLAIVQFGFIFNAYVTITNATREGARNGTVYIYDAGLRRPRTTSPATSSSRRPCWRR